MLINYFGDAINYCESYEHPDLMMDQCPWTNLQKTHDFDLTEQIVSTRQYLVQTRNPEDSIRSWHKSINGTGPLADFYQQMVPYWIRFHAKWCRDEDIGPPRLIIRYEDLIRDPINHLAKAIHFLGGHPINWTKVADIVTENWKFGLVEK